MKKHLAAGFCLCILPLATQAADPAWWTATETRILSATAPASNFAPVTVGQLKHVAQQAAEHLNASLAPVGGAGPAINGLVSNFEPRTGVTYLPAELEQIKKNNHSMANLGQIKNVAKPFYDRLIAIGYDTKANLLARSYPTDWAYYYPWIPETLQESNYVPANLGQLKMIFSFSLAGFDTALVDADEDGMPDVWEINNGLDPHDALGDNGAYGDLDNDGVPNASEYSGGGNPNQPPPDPTDLDADGMVDTTETGRGKVVGPKDHPNPQLRLWISY